MTSDAASDVVKFVIGAITIIVVAVPEGLPLAVTMVIIIFKIIIFNFIIFITISNKINYEQ